MGTHGARGGAGLILFLPLLLLAAACSSGHGALPGSATTTAPVTPTTAATGSPGPSGTGSSPAVTAAGSPAPGPTATVSPGPRTTPVVQVSQTSGSTTNLKIGQVISLKLAQHSDGGYTWQFSKQPDAAVLGVVTDQSLPASSSPSSSVGNLTPGATGFHRWTFQAVGAGTTSFTVVERRQGDANPLHDYSLTVVVSP